MWVTSVPQAIINSTISPNMTFTKTSQKFGQWADSRANTVYGLGFSTEHHLTKVHTHTHGCHAFQESWFMTRDNFATDVWSRIKINSVRNPQYTRLGGDWCVLLQQMIARKVLCFTSLLQERHLSSVAAVKMHDNWLIMWYIEILDAWKETSVSIYVPDDSDKLSARANDGRESEMIIKPNLGFEKKKCFGLSLSRGRGNMIFFFQWRWSWYIMCGYVTHFLRFKAEVMWLASHISAALSLVQPVQWKPLRPDHRMWSGTTEKLHWVTCNATDGGPATADLSI